MLTFGLFVWFVLIVAGGSPFVGHWIAKKVNASLSAGEIIIWVASVTGFLIALILVLYLK